MLQVQPANLQSAVRLYSGLGVAALAKLLSRRRFRSSGYWILGNSKLTVTTSGVIARIRPRTTDLAVFAGSQEPKSINWLRLKERDIVVDVGAHIGRYALLAAKRGATVVAIEPEPSNFSLLRENVELNRFSNVILCQYAISNTKREGTLFLGDNGRGDTATASLDLSMMEKRLGKAIPRFTTQVECETLDHLMKSLHISHINWLKIDVEFHEVSVLEGAENTLPGVENLIIEVTQSNEDACVKLARAAGLIPARLERNTGWRVNNWWFSRSSPA